MKVIKRLLVAFILVFGTVLLFANKQVAAAEFNDVAVTINAVVEGVEDETPLYAETVNYGQEFNVDATTHADDIFVFWVVNGLVEVDRTANTSFIATNDFTAYAFFTKGANKAVVFIDSNGKVIDTQFVAEVSDAEEPAELPDKIGFDRDGWTTVEYNGHELRTLQYVRNSESVITINGVEYGYNDIATLTLPSEHTHWLDEEENVVSYKSEFKLSALENRTFTSAAGGTSTDLVTLRTLNEYRSGHTTFLGQVDLLSGSQLVEFGLEVDGVLRPTPIINPETNEFLISIPGTMPEGVVVRSYAVVRQGIELVTLFDREVEESRAGTYTTNFALMPNSTTDIDERVFGDNKDLLVLTTSSGSASQGPRNYYGIARMYSVRASGNGNEINVALGDLFRDDYYISEIEFSIGGTVAKAQIKIDDLEVYNDTPSNNSLLNFSNLEASSFMLKNIHQGGSNNLQLYTNSITVVIERNIPLTDEQKLEQDKQNLEIGYSGSNDFENVTDNLTLPLIGGKGSTITWVSNDASIVVNNETGIGTVTRPEGTVNKTVTLTATIKSGEFEDTKEFVLTVRSYIEYVVTFMDGDVIISTVQVENGLMVTKPTDPIKDELAFDGWYLIGTEIEFDFTAPITEDIILESRWKDLYITISEALALPHNTEVYIKAILHENLASNNNFLIKDETGTLLMYASGSQSTLASQIGKEIIVKGTRDIFGGVEQINVSSYTTDITILEVMSDRFKLMLDIEEFSLVSSIELIGYQLTTALSRGTTINWILVSGHSNDHIDATGLVVSLPETDEIVVIRALFENGSYSKEVDYEITFKKEVVAYTVTFNDGITEVNVLIKEDELILVTEIPIFTKEGFEIEGWYTDLSDELTKWDFEADRVNEDLTLHSNWVEKVQKEPITIEILSSEVTGSYSKRTFEKAGITLILSEAMKQNNKIQMRNGSTFYNEDGLNKIKSITFHSVSQGTSFTMKAGSVLTSINTTISQSVSGSVYTFDFTGGDYSYFEFKANSSPQFDKVVIVYYPN